jgi:hypothetical protein
LVYLFLYPSYILEEISLKRTGTTFHKDDDILSYFMLNFKVKKHIGRGWYRFLVKILMPRKGP